MLRCSSLQGFPANHTVKSRWMASGALKKWSVGSFHAVRSIFPSQLQHPAGRGVGGVSANVFPLSHTARFVQYATNAANFETQVLQSQQAICLVYYIRNTNCSAYLRQTEELVDEINSEISGNTSDHQEETPSQGEGGKETNETLSTHEGKTKKPQEWLKLCTINADENRNLASAFSVERSKLPITYFIMQGTIIDKVIGHIAATRLRGILHKFIEHYQKEMNVDLLARTNKEAFKSGGLSNPIPSAATADLLDSASTSFMQEKILSALAGVDMIRLPEEANLLDGIRKTLQQAKKKAHRELQDLHQELGMGIRRLSDTELHARYYKSAPFLAMAVISTLEALFLARSYAALGDIAKQNVIWAKQSIQREFEPVLGDAKVRRLLALVDANLVKGDLRLAIATTTKKLHELQTSSSILPKNNEGKEAEAPLRDSLQAEKELLEESMAYFSELMEVIDQHVDTRAVGGGFPDAIVEKLLAKLKEDVKLSKLSSGNTESSESASTLKNRTRQLAEERVSHTKTILTCLISLFASDPKGPATRSRLFSILY
ncbi:unnamed protein product [Phytomonas sp. EM1]|nr:unnamed protein product [Phytomonas sp. EM1]|eukprot:CCW65137.1 unnamed protein product [Phytomonas sp. isolate EM1]